MEHSLRISYRPSHRHHVNSESTGKWEVQLRKGCVELAILASLWPGRLYGLEMLRRLEYCSGLMVSEGTIYPLLGRLERKGLIEAEWVETGLGHPRKYYTLTAAGSRRTLEMTRLWSSFTKNFDQLLRPLRDP
jgi:PadR family transcriptional regulator, regulatory protein PadR